ncbi:MAG: hypothetical protein Q9Q40_06180 [Acidobacteriota bacterium]|nr:hypothetical protein [Acidobacteriota bacterium]MDQ7086651.1 hypothetical protein [Acidobacteriota bacterium]
MIESSSPLSAEHPVVLWIRREVLPLIVERWAPEEVIVFDPPGRTAALDRSAPGVLIIAHGFESVPVAERVAQVRAGLAGVTPVRPLCLTPGEFSRAAGVPGPVLAAARGGIRLLGKR